MGVVYNSRKFGGDHLYSFCDTRLETEPVVLFSRGRDSMSKVGGGGGGGGGARCS